MNPSLHAIKRAANKYSSLSSIKLSQNRFVNWIFCLFIYLFYAIFIIYVGVGFAMQVHWSLWRLLAAEFISQYSPRWHLIESVVIQSGVSVSCWWSKSVYTSTHHPYSNIVFTLRILAAEKFITTIKFLLVATLAYFRISHCPLDLRVYRHRWRFRRHRNHFRRSHSHGWWQRWR